VTNMKKIFAVILTASAFFLGTMAAADISPKIIVNQKILNTELLVHNDRIYVPLRAVSEALGAEVGWDDETKTASITSAGEANLSDMIAEVSGSVVAIVGNYNNSGVYSAAGVEGTAHGTGVVIKSGGEILTNAHVVAGLENIIVVMSDGMGYEARLKYMDESIDLAVIKIDRLGLRPIKFAEPSSIVTGKTVVAIGTPISFSLRNSASRGIISGVNCQMGSDYRLIQTDAAINPGNSGGPLVNTAGELVGINSSKFAHVAVEGMGFAIPVDTVKYTLSQFENYGRVRRAYTGIDFEESWASRMGLPTQDGLTVTKVLSGSKGAQAGILAGDIVKAVGGITVHSLVDYNEAMKYFGMGEYVEFSVERGGQAVTLWILLEEK
jgi:serine protease Do